MSTSLSEQPVSVTYGEFEDGHLTLQQKRIFWGKFRADGEFKGVYYSGIMFQLAQFPALSKEVYNLYTAFTKAHLPHVQSAEEQTFATPNAEINMKNKATEIGGISNTSEDAAPTIVQAITDNASSQEAAVPSCNTSTNTYCLCTNPLTATDDTYCEDCRSFFVVVTKSLQFRAEALADFASKKAKNKTVPATNTTSGCNNPAQGTAQQFHTSTTYMNQAPLASFNDATPTPNAYMSGALLTIQGFTPDTNYATPSQSAHTPQLKSTQAASSPQIISLLTPPPSSPSMPAATPKKKSSKPPFPHNTCKKCKRDFPVNHKKNNGIICTQCTRKAEREKEAMPQGSAVESLPWTALPPVPFQNSTSLKRKAEDKVVDSIEDAPPASKKMKASDVVVPQDLTVVESIEDAAPAAMKSTLNDMIVPQDMTVVESIEQVSPANQMSQFDDLFMPQDMTEEEKLYYGFTTAWV